MNARPARLAFAAAFAAVALAAGASEADAPAGHYTVGAGAAAGTVYDTKSKLTWQQAPAPGAYTWANAKTYCTSLNLNGTGWRLPTEKELFSLVDRSQTSAPVIDRTAFPSTPASFFWSSTLVFSSPSATWYVNFIDGRTASLGVSNTLLVRCVR